MLVGLLICVNTFLVYNLPYIHVRFFFVFSLNRANFTFFLLESFLLEFVLAESTGGSPGLSVLGALDSKTKYNKMERRIDESSGQFTTAQNGRVSSKITGHQPFPSGTWFSPPRPRCCSNWTLGFVGWSAVAARPGL